MSASSGASLLPRGPVSEERQDGSASVARRLRVAGIVQGVGFRPYVWHLARELGLAGWVRNDSAGVEILVDGEPGAVADFTRRLPIEIPPLAQVTRLDWRDSPAARTGSQGDFAILASAAGTAATMIGHDTAVCPDCLAELCDPKDRRYRYAFVNCTHCGPRYTLTRGLPYDRSRTSMAAFPLCPDCEGEYLDPANRRFHAEPTACPVCGPRMWIAVPGPSSPLSQRGTGADLGGELARPEGASRPQRDPIAETLARLMAGQIVAIKGLGGFHLACDARNGQAVQRLRERKDREEKPFALMAANPASVADWVELTDGDLALLTSPERPICLLRKRPGVDGTFPGIAPGLAWLGAMLPYTPIHWLLFHEAAGRPVGTEWTQEPQPLVLVMTSANPGGEPLAIANDEALARLGGIADALLLHDREILVRCDDSVVRAARTASLPETGAAGPAGFQLVRRARGYTPRAIRLARPGPPVLALGGWLKCTLCVTRGDEAFVSQHIGGLDNPATCEMLMEVTEHLLGILEVEPQAIAHDLHPDFFSTRHAQGLAERWGVPAVPVQHHHAHIAAVAAEHGVAGPVLGLALDGVGLGSDGSAWGGELLRVQEADWERLGHLEPLPLPGGDRAAREPWRMAAAALWRLGRGGEIAARFPGQPAARHIEALLERGTGAPPTTSLGRWLDAAAGLLGVREVMAYEGQAAMLLEGLADAQGPLPPLAGGWRLDAGRLDLLPLLAHLSAEPDAARGAALCHATLAHALADWAVWGAETRGLETVALGGGCFLNHILTRELTRLLAERGLRVLVARHVPPNDGGLSLGQAWVAMHR